MRDRTPLRNCLLAVAACLILLPMGARADSGFEPFDATVEDGRGLAEQISSQPPARVSAPSPRASAPRSAPLATRTSSYTAEGDGGSADNRPTADWSIGIGAGWVLGNASLIQPNTTSVRIGLGRRFSLEPYVVLGLDKTRNHSFLDDPRETDLQETEQGDLTNAIGLGVDGRIVLATRDNLDLQMLAGLNFYRRSDSPFGRDLVENEDLVPGEQQSYLVSTTVNWGMGIQWHFKPNLALSADAVNPLANWSRTGQYTLDEVTVVNDDEEPSTEWREQLDRQTQSDIGLVFRPRIRVMFHLYF